jgi:hypothetical protein
MHRTIISQAEDMIAQGRRRAAARLLLGHPSPDTASALDGLEPDGPHGTVLAERLRFGPPETWSGWLRGIGRVAVKLWPKPVPELPAFTHPRVAPLLASGADWRVTAWIEGVTLTKTELNIEQAMTVLTDIEEALEALHGAGLAHGDLNAANVVLTPEGRAVLIDWGEPQVEGEPDAYALARLAALLL